MASPAWYDDPIWQGFKWTPQNTAAHSGIDLGMPQGTPLTALLPGTVISVGMEPWKGQVNLQHEWLGIGPIVVSYLHGSELLCSAGQHVEPGQVVMLSGMPPAQYSLNGNPVPHCHFEVTRGTLPPYMSSYGPTHPTTDSYPIDGTFLLNYAKGGGSMPLPTGWHDDGATLTAPNGEHVVRGFRQHILDALAWPAALVPLAAEYAQNPGVRQDFALALEWAAASNTVAEVDGEVPTAPSPGPDPQDAKNAAAIAALRTALAG